MTKYDDFWPDIDLSSGEKSPIELLSFQAQLIDTKTKGVLKGEIEITTDEEVIYNTLYIIAPKLDNYRYSLLKTASASKPYPIFIYDNSRDEGAIRVESPRAIIHNPFGLNTAIQRENIMKIANYYEKVEFVGRSIPEPDFKATSYLEFERFIKEIVSSVGAASVIHSLIAQSTYIKNNI